MLPRCSGHMSCATGDPGCLPQTSWSEARTEVSRVRCGLYCVILSVTCQSNCSRNMTRKRLAVARIPTRLKRARAYAADGRGRPSLVGENVPRGSLWSKSSIYAGCARCNKTNAKDLEARRRSADVPGEGRRATATASHQLLTPCWALDGVCPCMLHG